MNDARDGRGPDGEDAEAGREPAADTSGLDAGDWLAAQFADDDADDDAVDDVVGDGPADDDVVDDDDVVADGDVVESGLRTAATPISAETVRSAPFTVPPAPTAESEVVKSSGHPMALDLSALAGAVPPPSTDPTPSVDDAGAVGVADDQEDASDASAGIESEPVAPPRYEVPPAVAPRPVAAPPVVPSAVVPPVEPEDLAVDEPEHRGAPASEDDVVAPQHPDEPGPFTALISPPVAPEPVFPSAFDWSTPADPDDRGEAAPQMEESADSDDVGAAEPEPAEEAPVSAAEAADDAQTRAFEVPATEPEPETELHEPVAAPEFDVEMPETETEPGSAEPELAAEPQSEPEPAAEQSEPEPAAEQLEQESSAEATTPEPWWIAEHHEMTRRERREAEAAGVIVPPAVAPEPDVDPAVAGADDVGGPSGAGAVAAPPAGLPFGAPAPAESAPSAGEQEPTFTELLGIVRPSSGSSETVEDTPGDPAADAGRSDLVDPGPLPAGGSWALSDELAAEEPAARAVEEPEPGDVVPADERDEPVDLDDPSAALGVEAEEDAPDAATTALPVAGAGLAAAAATGSAAAAETTSPPTGERPRSVPHTEAELPGLSVGGGSASAAAAASSAAPPLVPRGGPFAQSADSGAAAGSSAAGSGGGIASWSRGRKVLLGVAAALVIVLALVALFVLSRSLFAGTPQPTEAPAAAAVATRTVTAAPAEIAQEAAAGPLSTGTHPWSDLQGGECFSAFEDAWQQDYEVVDCGQPHVAQLASIGALDADPAAAYPGSDALQSQMSVLCTGASALDLAAASTYPDAQFSASWPSTDAEWAAGVRSYWCFVDRSSGEPMTTSVAPAAA